MFPLNQIGYYCYSLNSPPLAKTHNSTVYVGTHMLTKQTVAIKEIPKQKKIQTHQQKLQVQLLINEIDTLFELQQCENILHLLDVYQTEQYVYIITNFYKNGDLELLLQSLDSQLLSEKQALGYITKIYLSYYELFKRNILHRDLKLANVFLSDNRIILADFGYCIKYDPKKNDGVVQGQVNVGSPLYMAPQIYFHNQYSVKSEIWALGIMFYELLTKQTPWFGQNERTLFDEIKKKSIQQLIPENLTQVSKKILIKSLQYDPKKRIGFEELLSLVMIQKTGIKQFEKCTSEAQTKLNEPIQQIVEQIKDHSQKSLKYTKCSTNEDNPSQKLKFISTLPNKYITKRKNSTCSLLL